VTATQVVLDTGTRSLVPPIPGLDSVPYLHAGNWLDREDLPAHLAILGGGVVGLEMAQFYARLGSRVTLIARSQLAGRGDPEVADALREALASDGVAFRFSVTVERVTAREGGIELALAGPGGAATL